jgi:hypothetical protein
MRMMRIKWVIRMKMLIISRNMKVFAQFLQISKNYINLELAIFLWIEKIIKLGIKEILLNMDNMNFLLHLGFHWQYQVHLNILIMIKDCFRLNILFKLVSRKEFYRVKKNSLLLNQKVVSKIFLIIKFIHLTYMVQLVCKV